MYRIGEESFYPKISLYIFLRVYKIENLYLDTRIVCMTHLRHTILLKIPISNRQGGSVTSHPRPSKY